MKNKEIEELLKNCKIWVKTDDIDYTRWFGLYELSLLLSYIEQLEKQAELGEHYKHLYSEVKKQKDDVVEYIKEIKKHREENLTITEYKAKWRSMFDYLESDEIIHNLLRMLGEIDVKD